MTSLCVTDRVFRCERKCNKLRSCQRHKCGQHCCVVCEPTNKLILVYLMPFWRNPQTFVQGDHCLSWNKFSYTCTNIPIYIIHWGGFFQSEEHDCNLICGKKLPCGLHKCEEPCHRGNCPPCLMASKWTNQSLFKSFLPASPKAKAGLGVQSLRPSVRPSVCPSVCPSVRPKILSSQLLWNYWSNYHETWYVARTSYVVMHIGRKIWSPHFCGSYALWNLENTHKWPCHRNSSETTDPIFMKLGM